MNQKLFEKKEKNLCCFHQYPIMTLLTLRSCNSFYWGLLFCLLQSNNLYSSSSCSILFAAAFNKASKTYVNMRKLFLKFIQLTNFIWIIFFPRKIRFANTAQVHIAVENCRLWPIPKKLMEDFYLKNTFSKPRKAESAIIFI